MTINKLEIDNIVIWQEQGKITYVWWNKGMREFPIRNNERYLGLEAMFDVVKGYMDQKLTRCTGFGREHCNHKDLAMEKIAGYPLFSGVVCSECWARHQAQVKQQVKDNNRCIKCNQPRLLCCC